MFEIGSILIRFLFLVPTGSYDKGQSNRLQFFLKYYFFGKNEAMTFSSLIVIYSLSYVIYLQDLEELVLLVSNRRNWTSG